MDLEKGMAVEHSSTGTFTTTNYNIVTSPSKEYKIVTGEEQCPDCDMRDSAGRVVRRIVDVEELLKLAEVKKAGLEKIECMAVVRIPLSCFEELDA